ncbi:hypothetical protein QNH20_19265 [Neobacillus sp. WH10]|uniref:hypothetical protein n=1 Tax=Neobacillus sp. WH10 TaxID=3047873 RepID=UPI0024C0FDA5|nr:hypothetical protein [Neobacillus sp. WH10]WHY76246.1 hypothetical protein QNH20_19265 [Neobacillus sp. WH10]
MEFTKMMLSQPSMHDINACKAWREFQSLPYKARYYDMMAIANKYKTTPKEMREHKVCWKHYR